MNSGRSFNIKSLIFSIVCVIFFIGCSSGSSNTSENSDSSLKYGTIAHIEEASGIGYCAENDALYVAADDGILYRLDKDGTIVQKKNLKNLKNHDFEGIACDAQNDEILVAIEGSDNVLVLTRDLTKKKTIDIDRKDDRGRLILKKDSENGLEGIVADNGDIYISNQSFRKLPDDDPSVVFKIDPVSPEEAKISEIFDHGFSNISGLAFQKGFLYMVSDTGNLLIKYDIKTKQVLSTVKIKSFDDRLKGQSIEGVTFDNDGNIYFASDNGGTIYRYKFNQ